MNFPLYFDSKNSLNLYGLEKDFNFLSNLYLIKKLPKVLLLSGLKGSGKSTLINLMGYKKVTNYANNLKKKILLKLKKHGKKAKDLTDVIEFILGRNF